MENRQRLDTRASRQAATAARIVQQRLDAFKALRPLRVLSEQRTPGGEARKHLLELADGSRIEVVLMRYQDRFSACISTQVGCACGCVFCATGQAGFVRDVAAEEIVAQVLYVQSEMLGSQTLLSNFVLMGMGEPLLNYDATLRAVRWLVDPRGAAFVERRVTLSTVGVVPGIERLAREGLGIRLAVSLHGATDAVRDMIVPTNRRWPLDELFGALHVYAEQTQRRVMLEWVMIDAINDMPAQAEALVSRLDGLPAHVNIIQLNPTPHYSGKPSPQEAVDGFVAILERAQIPHTMRQRRGSEISAGCGQLGAVASSPLRESADGGIIAEQYDI